VTTSEMPLSRYAVDCEEGGSYEQALLLYVVCKECRDKALAERSFLYVGRMTEPEVGCLGSSSAHLGVDWIMELVMEHERTAHL